MRKKSSKDPHKFGVLKRYPVCYGAGQVLGSSALSLSLVASRLIGDVKASEREANIARGEKMIEISKNKATYIIKEKDVPSIKTHIATTARCSTGFCGAHSGSCCPGYYCVGLGVSEGVCETCSTGSCLGGHFAPCCSGYYCVGLGVSSGTCMRCAESGSSCLGGYNPPCCSGLTCAGLGVSSGYCV